jgi:hypothetical protein|tara:strand:+ start:169 stop:387 length:219 start_codon:yes stop_codon:yes gene_type:complete
MYYIYKPTINMKKESDISGDFKVTMEMNNIVVETTREFTEAQIINSQTKLKQILKKNFSIKNLDIELINIIK